MGVEIGSFLLAQGISGFVPHKQAGGLISTVEKSDGEKPGGEGGDKFPGCVSKRVNVSAIPEKCNWSQIRKMFGGSSRIQNGKVELKAGTAWVQFDDADVAKKLVAGYGSGKFEDGEIPDGAGDQDAGVMDAAASAAST